MKQQIHRHGRKYRERGSGTIFHGHKIISVKGKRVFEHRYLLEQHLGRKLLGTEMVHHINENKLDNRIENLEIVTKSQHKKLHKNIGEKTRFKQKYNFSPKKVLELYEEIRNAEKVGHVLGCAEITVRRIIKKITTKSLNQLVHQYKWTNHQWANRYA